MEISTSKGKTIATGEEGKKSEDKSGTLMGTKEIKPDYRARRNFSIEVDSDYDEKTEALSLDEIKSIFLEDKKEDSEEEEDKEENTEGEEENSSEGEGRGGGGGNEDEEDYSGFKCLNCGKYFPDFIKLQRHKVTCLN